MPKTPAAMPHAAQRRDVRVTVCGVGSVVLVVVDVVEAVVAGELPASWEAKVIFMMGRCFLLEVRVGGRWPVGWVVEWMAEAMAGSAAVTRR
jgi:hypothetical protein